MPVRLTHWAVACLFAANYFFTEPGGLIHERIGYAAVALVVLRLAWGALRARGPNRLAALKPSIADLREHAAELRSRRRQEHVGHNPAGIVAVWAIWLCLLAIAVSGWISTTDFGIDRETEDIHELFVNILAGLVCLHIAAVALMSWWMRRNLLLAMIAGRFKER